MQILLRDELKLRNVGYTNTGLSLRSCRTERGLLTASPEIGCTPLPVTLRPPRRQAHAGHARPCVSHPSARPETSDASPDGLPGPRSMGCRARLTHSPQGPVSRMSPKPLLKNLCASSVPPLWWAVVARL